MSGCVKTLAVVLCLTASSRLSGQFSGAIQGTITDQTQAVIPGVAVQITNSETGQVRSAQTQADGVYRILSLAPGKYSVRVEKAGFAVAENTAVEVRGNEVVRADFVLKTGSVTENVTVTAATPMVETEQGRITASIDRTQLREMPLNGRNIYNIIAIQPGVTGRGLGGAANTGSNDLFSGETRPDINASGQRAEANNFTVDDTSVNGAALGGVSNLTPNPDSVEEVRVVANNFSAVDGRNPGAQIQVTTKSGTNQFHGSLSHYFSNNTLSARNFFEPDVPVFRKNQYNYTIGGPIVKNRTFFFHSFEGLRQSGARGQQATVETQELMDFVKRSRPNSIAATLLSKYPPVAYASYGLRDLGSPARGVGVAGAADRVNDIGNIFFTPRAYRDGQQFSGRLDHDLIAGKSRLYGTFYTTNANTLNGGARPAFDRARIERTWFGNVNHTQVLSPTAINELRLGLNRLRGGPAVPSEEIQGIPTITVPLIASFGSGNFPAGYAQTNYHLKDVFSLTRSSHSVKFGGEVRRMVGIQRTSNNYIPRYSFQSVLDFMDDEPLETVRDIDPQTGLPVQTGMDITPWEWALFVNDDWKLHQRLTLNLGLRYEYYGTWAGRNRRGLVFGPGNTYQERLANGKVDFVDQFYKPDNTNFAPRIGFAYDLTGHGRTTLRGGFGLAYDRIFQLPGQQYEFNPPLRASVRLGPRYGTSFTYALGDASKPHLGYPVDPAFQVGLDDRNGVRGARVQLYTFDPLIKSPYTYNWLLGLQHELFRGLVIEAGYLGSMGQHLVNVHDVNRFSGDLLDGRFDGLNPSFSSIYMVETNSKSNYHGLTFSARKRLQAGFTLQANYTYGKAIADTEVARSVVAWQNGHDRRAERAPADYDARHRLSAIGLWDMPFFRSGGSLVRGLFGGWQLAGFMILQSAYPISPIMGAPWPTGDFNADGTNNDRPDAPAANVRRSGWSQADFLNGIFSVSDFPAPTPGRDGNLGRNTFRGPGFAQIDASLSKRFAITERMYLQVRLDAFNALNRVNLENPVMNLNNRANFGRSVGALSPRSAQIGARLVF